MAALPVPGQSQCSVSDTCVAFDERLSGNTNIFPMSAAARGAGAGAARDQLEEIYLVLVGGAAAE